MSMTWGDFKQEAERQGIKDEMDIWFIDVSFPSDPTDISACPQEEGSPNDIGFSIT